MTEDLDVRWKQAKSKIESIFGEDIDLEGILFIIGMQELGKGPQKLSKDQKMDVIHIAVCSLLSRYGYYELIGEDKDGWPHWERTKKLPQLKPGEQDRLMRQAITEYMETV